METRNVSPVFVGRAEELRVLGEALARADAAEPQALLLGGEAGVGKTRLVEEFAAAATRRGAVVAVGGCVEIGADGLPFAPVSTALRVLRRELPGELAAAAAGQEDELARLLPELGDVVPGRHDDEGMARLFELTARLLEELSAARTVVLVIEDIHWADTSTRHLLAYLLRTLRTGRLLILTTYRSDDVHRRHPLRPLLAELDRLRTVRRVELARFSRDEVARQLTGIQGAAPSPHRAEEIYRRSDGNAFFVEELACSDSADSLHDLLLVRVERLPDDAQRVVRILAEAGSSVEHRLLAAVAELPEDRLNEALRAAVGANLLLAEVEGDCYRFRHSLVREAVADDLLPGERARVNRRLAEALEADPTLVAADRRVTRLAGYWYCAHDAAKALPAVLTAALQAGRRHAYAEQLRLLERALELWDIVPDEVRGGLRAAEFEELRLLAPEERPGGLDHVDLLSEAAVAGRLCGERDRALKLARRALKLLDENQDPLRAAWFWDQTSLLVQAQARGDGRAELDKARELTRGLPPSRVHAWVLAHSAAWAMLRHQGPEAIAAAEHAVEYARMVGSLPVELNARTTLGCQLFHSGDISGGLRELYAVKEEAIAAGLTHQAARVYVNLPSELESVGRSREAVAMLEEGAAFTKRYGLVVSRTWVHANLTESLGSLGDWDGVLRADEKTQRIGHAAKPQGIGRLTAALVMLHRGAVDEAARLLEEARELFGTSDRLPQESIPLAAAKVMLASALGRADEARAVLLCALDAGLPLGAVAYSWPLLIAGAEAEIASGAADEEVLERLRTEGRRQATPAPVWQAHDLWLRAALRRASGAPGKAAGAGAGAGDAADALVDEWSAAVAAFETLERPHDLARVRLRLAEALLARGGDGDAARAAELLELAGAVARHLGARPLADAAEALLPSRAAREPGDGFGLTARERDVLPLVAAGRSNRQIADALHISPKTASVHVSNILAKLGVATRGEAAALAHRRGLVGSGDRA